MWVIIETLKLKKIFANIHVKNAQIQFFLRATFKNRDFWNSWDFVKGYRRIHPTLQYRRINPTYSTNEVSLETIVLLTQYTVYTVTLNGLECKDDWTEFVHSYFILVEVPVVARVHFFYLKKKPKLV